MASWNPHLDRWLNLRLRHADCETVARAQSLSGSFLGRMSVVPAGRADSRGDALGARRRVQVMVEHVWTLPAVLCVATLAFARRRSLRRTSRDTVDAGAAGVSPLSAEREQRHQGTMGPRASDRLTAPDTASTRRWRTAREAGSDGSPLEPTFLFLPARLSQVALRCPQRFTAPVCGRIPMSHQRPSLDPYTELREFGAGYIPVGRGREVQTGGSGSRRRGSRHR